MKPYWWCLRCEREIDGSRVTYEELCDVCGSAVNVVEREDMEMNEHQKDTRIEQLERELRFKQRQLDQRDDELSGLKLKIRDLHDQLKKMVEAYRDTSLKAAYEHCLAKTMADAMDCMDDIVLRPATWKPGTPTDADQIVSMVNACAVHGQYGP